MFGHIVQSVHAGALLVAATAAHKDHSAATWILPVVLVLVLLMFMRRQGLRGRRPGAAGRAGGPPPGSQSRPRSARQAMQAPASAWESDTDSDQAAERSSDT